MPPRKPKATRELAFGSKVVPVTPRAMTPAARPREWETFPGGKVGWSWESRDWVSIPDDGREPRGNFTSRVDAVEYLTNNRT